MVLHMSIFRLSEVREAKSSRTIDSDLTAILGCGILLQIYS
jgi:hypothetical protein